MLKQATLTSHVARCLKDNQVDDVNTIREFLRSEVGYQVAKGHPRAGKWDVARMAEDVQKKVRARGLK